MPAIGAPQRTPSPSSRTFGPQDNDLLRPPTPHRAPSPKPVLDDRPVLVRAVSKDAERPSQDIDKMYRSNMFADPTVKRAWYKGPPLFTDGHERLLYILREECGRLYGHSQKLKQQLLNAETRATKIQADLGNYKTRLAEVRAAYQRQQDELRDARAELAEAKEGLADMDAMFATAKAKRSSRIYGNVAGMDVGQNAPELGEHAF